MSFRLLLTFDTAVMLLATAVTLVRMLLTLVMALVAVVPSSMFARLRMSVMLSAHVSSARHCWQQLPRRNLVRSSNVARSLATILMSPSVALSVQRFGRSIRCMP